MRRTIAVVALLAASLAVRLDAQAPRPGQGPPPQPGQGPRTLMPNSKKDINNTLEQSGYRPDSPPQQDPFGRFLFPPELVMQHQGEINLQDSQRTALQGAMQQAQSKFGDLQWRLSGEGEKLARLLQGPTPDEGQVLEQVDRVLAAEREVKRTQIGLLVRIKNTLTPAQQAKLMELRVPPRP